MNTKHIALAVLALSGCLPGEMESNPDETPTPTADSPRVLDGLSALYTFDEGRGLEIKDTSGSEPALDLQVDNLLTNHWLPDGGIEITGPSVITSPDVAETVFADCVKANALSIEMWIEPASVDQDGTIFSYGKDGQRNASLSVNLTRYQGSVLTATPDPATPGEMITSVKSVQTPENIAAVAAQHVVYTRDVDGAAVYVNGADTKPPMMTMPPTEPQPVLDQTEWNPAYQLVLGNITNGDSPWLGKIYLAAVYCKKLSGAEVTKNFTAGY
jgi:hypothetical protein